MATGGLVKGYILAESIRPGARLEGLNLRLTKVERYHVSDAAPDQPQTWTTIEFETGEDPERLAQALAAILDDEPSRWYTDFAADEMKYVIFPGRIFRHSRDDGAGRAEAKEYARTLGIPEGQIDWEG
jgi:hypothetical protein